MTLRSLDRVYGRLQEGLAVLAAAILAVMLLGVTADVILRNVLVAGIRGVVEYTEFGLYLSGVLAAPWLLRQGQHIRADLISQFGPANLAHLLDVISEALGFLVTSVIGWYAAVSARESHAIGSAVRRTVEIPEWWLIAPLAFVMALLAGEFLLRLVHAVSVLVRGPRQQDEASRGGVHGVA
jgi:TRAP-type C4-dicarboxylate transport system permease small subunit